MTPRSFVLTGPEVVRALEAGGPLVDLQLDPAKLATMRIACVEVDGRIVAYWVLWTALHLEPLWITDEFRKSPVVVKHLLLATLDAAEQSGEPAAFAVIEETNLEAVGELATKLGFVQAPGALYYLVLRAPQPEGAT